MLGIVLGRFQPLHPGHRRLVETALSETEETVVCVGSAQLDDPIPISDRVSAVESVLAGRGRVVAYRDPEPMSEWPRGVLEACGALGGRSLLYRAESDRLSEEETRALALEGCDLRYLPRSPFPFELGVASSASEVRAAYSDSGMAIPALVPINRSDSV